MKRRAGTPSAVWWCVRIGLGLLFIWSGVTKLVQPGVFREAVVNFQLLPPWAVEPVVRLVPWWEICGGAALVLGWATAGAAALTAGLLALFSAAIASAMARGITGDCGCFGPGMDRSIGWAALLEDLALLGAALGVLWRWWPR